MPPTTISKAGESGAGGEGTHALWQTATALDSAIFRDIFSTADMRRVFSDEVRIAYYLEIEVGAGAGAGAARHHPE